MSKKKYKEYSDEALSRNLWRKTFSIDDEENFDINKCTFLIYERNHSDYDNYDTQKFPKNVKNLALRKALFSLTKKQLQIIELYFFANMSRGEIAKLLKCEHSSVAKLLKRAILKLYKTLKIDL